MKNEKDPIDNLFKKLDGQWDACELQQGHANRFLEKQTFKKKRINYWIPMSIAASILILVGVLIFLPGKQEATNLASASAPPREVDSVFTAAIKIELHKIRQKDSPENKKIISDALRQMQEMDADYEKIKQELIKNGESEQIIHAMILNLQTRISFLEKVMRQIEINNHLKIDNDEKTI